MGRERVAVLDHTRSGEGWTHEEQEALAPAYLRLPMLLFRIFSETEPEGYGELIASSCGELVPLDSAHVRIVPLEQLRPVLLGERDAGWPSRRNRWAGGLLTLPLVAHGLELGTVELRRRDGFTVAERALLRRFLDLAALGLHGALAQEEIRRIAQEDPLTGLANRRGLQAKLAEGEWPQTLLLADLDGLKALNDRLGFDAGDTLLMTVADEIRRWLPAGALACRLGGDEFVVSLPGTGELQGSQAAQELEERLSRVSLPPELAEHFRGASVGVVSARDREDPAELLRRAGIEMREQKRRRRTQRDLVGRR
jgi:diguanylate cyclase (GGDEF)-like protein